MAALEAVLTHVSTILVGGTGLVYAVMRYLLHPPDEFAVVNHPAQPAIQHLHLLVAPLLVFALGLVWHAHAQPSLRSGLPARRRSGLALLGTAAPMVVSGYLLQITASESWRAAWGTVHTLASLLWLAGFVVHRIGARQRAARG